MFLVGMLAGIIQFFVQFFTKKLGITLGFIAIFLSLTAGFIGVLQILLSTIFIAMPSEFSLAIGWFLPSNFSICIGAYYAAVVAKWMYDTKYRIIKAWNS